MRDVARELVALTDALPQETELLEAAAG